MNRLAFISAARERGRLWLALPALAIACGGIVDYRSGRCDWNTCPKAGIMSPDAGVQKPVGSDWPADWRLSVVSPEAHVAEQPLLLAANQSHIFAAADSYLPQGLRSRGVFAQPTTGAKVGSFIRINASGTEGPVVALAADDSGVFLSADNMIRKYVEAQGAWFQQRSVLLDASLCAMRVTAGRVVTVDDQGAVAEWDPNTLAKKAVGTVSVQASDACAVSIDISPTRIAIATPGEVALFDGRTSFVATSIARSPRLAASVAIAGDLVAVASNAPAPASKLALYTKDASGLTQVLDAAASVRSDVHEIACARRCEVATISAGLTLIDDDGVTQLALGAGPHVTSTAFKALPMRGATVTNADRLYFARADETETITATIASVLLPTTASLAPETSAVVPLSLQSGFGRTVAFAEATENNGDPVLAVGDETVLHGFVGQGSTWLPKWAVAAPVGERMDRVLPIDTSGSRCFWIETRNGAGERTVWTLCATAESEWVKVATLEEGSVYAVHSLEVAILRGDGSDIAVTSIDPEVPVEHFAVASRPENPFLAFPGADRIVVGDHARDGAVVYKRTSFSHPWTLGETVSLSADEVFGITMESDGAVALVRRGDRAYVQWRQAYDFTFIADAPLPFVPKRAVPAATTGFGAWLVDDARLELVGRSSGQVTAVPFSDPAPPPGSHFSLAVSPFKIAAVGNPWMAADNTDAGASRGIVRVWSAR